jgi:hypothetical protein
MVINIKIREHKTQETEGVRRKGKEEIRRKRNILKRILFSVESAASPPKGREPRGCP